jgi:tRNA modification GTPase
MAHTAALPTKIKAVKDDFQRYTTCFISLKEENALIALKEVLLDFLDHKYHNFSEEAFMIRERHAEAFSLAKNHLDKALILWAKKYCDDCLAAELKEALKALEQVVGRVDYERVLDQIFSKFCIGK